MVEPFLDETGRINPRHATLLKRSLHERGFLVNLLEFCSTSEEKSDKSSVFDKNGDCVLQGRNFVKRWSCIEFPLKIFFLEQLVFEMNSKQKSYGEVFFTAAVVCTLYVCNFTK